MIDPPVVAHVRRRTLLVLVVAQVLAGAGLAAGATTGALLAEDLLGSTALAGLPVALFTLGAAGAALLIGRLSQALGRRPGLAAGYGLGAAGSAGVVVASVVGNAPLLAVSLLCYGGGSAANLQARYAGADLADAAGRGKALSTVLVATTVGAVVGPNLTAPSGAFAEGIGVPALAGPFLLAFAAYGLGAVVLLVFLRPDPLLTARKLVQPQQQRVESVGGSRRLLAVAAVTLVLTQVVMVAIMTMTPVHMSAHGHGFTEIGLVVAVHVGCMYLPSPVTGVLTDRLGRRPVMAAAGVVLLAAGLLAATAPEHSVAWPALALGLLGLGWNLGLVGGTAMVTDAADLATRARVQGRIDLAVALAGATGGLSSGVVVATAGFAGLSVLGGVLAVCLLPLLLRR
ncbi:MFS transporter [Saccharopolyspora taberi]|uniref:MFS transporter n=1 Tax=Saccharopolyspora taberi TaxID=60895 RepID=A0ABN3VKM3_9PSEU